VNVISLDSPLGADLGDLARTLRAVAAATGCTVRLVRTEDSGGLTVWLDDPSTSGGVR